jgi:protein TonB
MKKFLFLIFICFAQNMFSQSKNTETSISIDDTQIYNTAGLDVKPEFPGGVDKFHQFIDENYIKPKEKPNLKGKIYTTFIIEKDGSLTDIKILRDLGFGTGNEAIRVLNLTPKWIPGKHNNKVVRVLFSVPIIVK